MNQPHHHIRGESRVDLTPFDEVNIETFSFYAFDKILEKTVIDCR
jgi:hypothetical protein